MKLPLVGHRSHDSSASIGCGFLAFSKFVQIDSHAKALVDASVLDLVTSLVEKHPTNGVTVASGCSILHHRVHCKITRLMLLLFLQRC